MKKIIKLTGSKKEYYGELGKTQSKTILEY